MRIAESEVRKAILFYSIIINFRFKKNGLHRGYTYNNHSDISSKFPNYLQPKHLPVINKLCVFLNADKIVVISGNREVVNLTCAFELDFKNSRPSTVRKFYFIPDLQILRFAPLTVVVDKKAVSGSMNSDKSNFINGLY